jgi:DNA-binding transcriptional ArsR family regulator
MDAQLRALAEPRRREILRLVWSQELPAGAIAERFSVTRPAISQHLSVLKEAGLIAERRDGTRRLYRARQDRLAEVRSFLETFWDESLAALKLAAEAEEREERALDERA